MFKLNINEINGKILSFTKGDIIFEENSLCSSIAYIIKGEITISTTSVFYNEFIISKLSEGEFFGESILFSSQPLYLGTVYASKNATILLISKKDYLNYISNCLEDYLSYTSDRHLLLQQRTKILLQKSIKEKIMFYLISKSNLLKSNIIPIKSKKDLSNYLNIERPSLSRELANLKKEKIIDYNKHQIILLKGTI